MNATSKSILLALLTLPLLQLTCRRESASEFVSVKSPLVALTHVELSMAAARLQEKIRQS